MNQKGIQQRLQWRRDKVRQLTILGCTQRDIAAQLQISLRLVEKDLASLREEAKENIRNYVDEYLPLAYQNCLEGLNKIVFECWRTSLSKDPDKDKRERLQALALIKECYAMQLDLLSKGTVIERAVNFVKYHKTVPLPSDDKNNELSIDQQGNKER